MKNIAIFCDGTWNTPKSRTNVHKLCQSTRTRHAECRTPLLDHEVTQVSAYFSGVGTDEENDIDWWDKVSGGAFGKGLDGIVSRAYMRICNEYDPGDRLFIFGFSRGAYTARSLIGLMRTCGIVDRARDTFDADIAEAMQIYRRRSGPDDADFAPAVRFRQAEGKSVAWVDDREKQNRRTEKNTRRPLNPRGELRFRYLGVWDTVGALGIPEKIPFSRHVNTKYRFHDCNLSTAVEYARHAVAIDEYRHAFEPTLWSKKSIQENYDIHREVRVEQDWFPGDHGSVGGGGEICSLSDAALDWVARGAEAAGMLFDRTPGSPLHEATNKDIAANPRHGPVFGELRNTEGPPRKIMYLRGRGGRSVMDGKNNGGACVLGQAADLSEGAFARLHDNPAYLSPDADDDDEARKTRGFRRKTLASVIPLIGSS